MSAVRVILASLLTGASGIAAACDMHGGRGFGLWAHLQGQNADEFERETDGSADTVVAPAPPSSNDARTSAPAEPEPAPLRMNPEFRTEKANNAHEPEDRRPRGVPWGDFR